MVVQMPLQTGDKVKVRAGSDANATVVAVIKDIKGGVKLDRPLGGQWCYCQGDLVKVE